ncbi:hypothetical protein RF11_14083 [Thelohanellus kitauei]|uniref:Uncharacterized protein n=1 Tax=Thelohanellus kitauei TaxID=669202 RepID=A0A0C2MDD7_THEKT|nr:hypothetical protein RF11_14083 [Thelohanellus kitauei]
MDEINLFGHTTQNVNYYFKWETNIYDNAVSQISQGKHLVKHHPNHLSSSYANDSNFTSKSRKRSLSFTLNESDESNQTKVTDYFSKIHASTPNDSQEASDEDYPIKPSTLAILNKKSKYKRSKSDIMTHMTNYSF